MNSNSNGIKNKMYKTKKPFTCKIKQYWTVLPTPFSHWKECPSSWKLECFPPALAMM